MNLIETVENGGSWREIIYDIVNSENFNPWDMDVGALADSYLDKIREIEIVNFSVPGTMVLVGSILVKLKSDSVMNTTSMFEDVFASEDMGELPEMDDFEAPEPLASDLELAPEASLYIRRVPKRKVTLPELMVFLRKVVAQVEEKQAKRSEITEEPHIPVKVPKKDLRAIMTSVFKEIKTLSKTKQGTTFSELVSEWKRENIVSYLFPLLHLANDERIFIKQEKLFGEITIKPNKG